jgi:hypothetical protein
MPSLWRSREATPMAVLAKSFNLAIAAVLNSSFTLFVSCDQSRIRELVETFDAFNEGDNPYGERDFGAFDYAQKRILWKIDYYDKSLEYGSEHPEDPRQTTRVLTIMLAEEY